MNPLHLVAICFAGLLEKVRPVPPRYVDYDVPLQDSEMECWEPFSLPPSRVWDFPDLPSDSTPLGGLSSHPPSEDTNPAGADAASPLPSAPAGLQLSELRDRIQTAYDDARLARISADRMSPQWHRIAGRATALSEVLGMLDSLIDGSAEGGQLW